MAYFRQENFAGGELDPALFERSGLNKFKNGLKTGRNVVAGKTGRIISRAGRKHVAAASTTSGRRVFLHGTYDGKYLEFGHQYVRAYGPDDSLLGSDTHSFDSDNFDNLQFLNIDSNNGNFSATRGTLVYGAASPIFVEEDGTVQSFSDWLWEFTATHSFSTQTNGGTGYAVQYFATFVVNGQESVPVASSTSTFSMVLNNNETNTLVIDIPNATISAVPGGTGLEEVRVYRLPDGGGAPGFIGSTTTFTTSGTNQRTTFKDIGQIADYSNQPPVFAGAFSAFTMALYQKRLMIGGLAGELDATRAGLPWSYAKDIPLQTGSPLDIKILSEDSIILRMVDNEGLILFTSEGVYIHTGTLSPVNQFFDRKGPWVIDFRVPPLSIPGGVIFVDSKTNSVKQLRYLDSKAGYVADEISIFSDHLFRDNRITSWAFQDGQTPLLWVTFADNTFASFTYEETQEMRAWTRHDSGTGVEYVASIKGYYNSTTFAPSNPQIMFVTKNGDNRFIERGVDRFITAEELETNSEAHMGEKIAAMDAIVSYSDLLNDDLTDDDITLTPVVADTWDGELTLAVTDDAIFPSGGDGAVGTIFRWFHPVDRTSIDLEITARTDDDEVTVQPSSEFPSAYATNPRLYVTVTSVSGLSHLNGENVSMIVDGYVAASPNNDHDSYDTVTPSSGSANIPDSVGGRGAIIHVGRPYVMDVETLEPATVEQRPIYNESVNVLKVGIATYQARGLFIGGRFPSTDLVKGSTSDKAQNRSMKPLIQFAVDYEDSTPILGNRYDQPSDLEYEVTVPGSWKSKGRVCLRQVDPLHFEILSITPDLDDQRR